MSHVNLNINRLAQTPPLTVSRRIGAYCTVDEIHRAHGQISRALLDDVLLSGLGWTLHNQHGKFTACLALAKRVAVDHRGTFRHFRIYEEADHDSLPPRVLRKLLSVDRWRRAILWHDRKRT